MTAQTVSLTQRALAKQARLRADNIRAMFESIAMNFEVIAVQLDEVKYDEAEWKALGHQTFEDYLRDEFGPVVGKFNEPMRRIVTEALPHFTQPEIAALTGVSRQTITRDKVDSADRKSKQMFRNQTPDVGNRQTEAEYWAGEEARLEKARTQPTDVGCQTDPWKLLADVSTWLLNEADVWGLPSKAQAQKVRRNFKKCLELLDKGEKS